MFAVLQRKVERLKAALTSTHSIMFGNASLGSGIVLNMNPHITATGWKRSLYIRLSKEPCCLSKEPYLPHRPQHECSHHSHWWETIPIFFEPSPEFFQRSPLFYIILNISSHITETLLGKEPYILSKEPCILHRSQQKPPHHSHWCEKSPVFYQKSPVFYQKSPVFYQKSPVFHQKSPGSIK